MLKHFDRESRLVKNATDTSLEEFHGLIEVESLQ